ncbi:MAG: hypothetical protein Ct9H300mP28_35720 [Pseudomonadota bacterium]|nr:MAG: hypothetical protein Ct9H300mP28_35720 [Pseudomonadota bacterium]
MVMLWKYPTGEPLAKLIGHKKPVTTLASAPTADCWQAGVRIIKYLSGALNLKFQKFRY